MSESPSIPDKASKPRARRSSSSRSKKTEKSAKAETIEPAKFPEFPSTAADKAEEVPTRGDWPEPEPATSGGGSGQENSKRKRRRKKGKGGGPSQAHAAADPESPDSANSPVTQPAQVSASQNKSARVKVDPEQLEKFAWKIYLAEVSEEGVALVGDHDARELSRRCFRLAEIFLEEQARHR
ncbi:MAG: hypothetical protein ACO3RK_02425 [Luteolibacter sp.]